MPLCVSGSYCYRECSELGDSDVSKRGNGQKYTVEMSGVAWLDLLGYGAMLRKAKFDPTNPTALAAVARLKNFQRIAAAHATRNLRAMIINDGVAYVRELSPRGPYPTYEFLEEVFDAYRAVNELDSIDGYPGARMVVAAGPRLHVLESLHPNLSHLRSIFKRLSATTITPQQAVMEAFNSVSPTGSQLSLQANFAFTKAFLADKDGSSAGLAGSSCFIDNVFFKSNPSWLTVDDEISWATEGMQATFLKTSDLDKLTARSIKYPEVRDGEEIAKSLEIDYPVEIGIPTRSTRL